MAEQFLELSDELNRFIGAQKVFIVATAALDGKINLSPKGQDSLRVLGPNEILWMNLTGSGNETAPHISAANRTWGHTWGQVLQYQSGWYALG